MHDHYSDDHDHDSGCMQMHVALYYTSYIICLNYRDGQLANCITIIIMIILLHNNPQYVSNRMFK